MKRENMKIQKKCHAELDSASSTHFVSQQQAWKIPNQVWNDAPLSKGFTLLEILIAVIIIAVLVAVAVPQYQKAVLKSRFSSLMPTTKAIRDGQEAYYMTNGTYANAIADLDVRAANTSGIEITPGSTTDTDLKYVFATRPNMHNNLIMYQKHSPKFAGHTHCEALKNDTLSQWLCSTALHGRSIDGSVSGDEYETYVLEGELGPNDAFETEASCAPGGETKTCECGGPVTGTCEDGQWTYTKDCLVKPDNVSGTCSDGETIWTGTYQCNSAGTGWEPVIQGCGETAGKKSPSAETPYQYAGTLWANKYRCTANVANGCSWAEFSNGAMCATSVENGCANSTFSGTNGPSVTKCMPSVAGACAGSLFTDGGKCVGGGAVAESCSGAIIGNGGVCAGGCAGAIIREGGRCDGGLALSACKRAIYEGGCCLGNYCPEEYACAD